MKQSVTFEYIEQRPNGQIKIFGSITIKPDGKVSISLLNGSRFSAATRYKAKQLAKLIVEAKFKHPAVTSIKKSDDSLVELLTEKTKELKVRWIEKTKTYTANYFKYMLLELSKKADEEYWLNKFGIEWEWKTQGSWNGKPYRSFKYDEKYYKMRDEIKKFENIVKLGYKKFEENEVRRAENHYTDCIWKLSDRLAKKGVRNDEHLKIKSGWVGVNLEMEFTYKDVYVRAWTVVAEGPIQCAHYRYLIK